jgi:hypothetical protein
MAERSTNVTLINQTPFALGLTSDNVSDGEWDTQPPASITAGESGNWQTENSSFMTGTGGSATYQFSVGTIFIEWSNPYIGDNSYNVSAPRGYSLNQDGGGGDNAYVSFTLAQA